MQLNLQEKFSQKSKEKRSKMEFKVKTATEALEKIANAPLEHHGGCDQILIDGLYFSMAAVQDYAKATLNNRSNLTIPKKVVEKLGEDNLTVLAWIHGNDLLGKVSDKERNAECKRRDAIVKLYLAGKILGTELVKVTDDC